MFLYTGYNGVGIKRTKIVAINIWFEFLMIYVETLIFKFTQTNAFAWNTRTYIRNKNTFLTLWSGLYEKFTCWIVLKTTAINLQETLLNYYAASVGVLILCFFTSILDSWDFYIHCQRATQQTTNWDC